MDATRALATVELLGALTYAQLRSFALIASAVRYAPDIAAAHDIATFAAHEHAGYELLRQRVRALTDLPERALERQRAPVDTFFDRLPIDDWWSAMSFFSIALPLAADFARAVAPTLEDDSRDTVVSAVVERDGFEDYAIERVATRLEGDPNARERARALAAEVIGNALTSFQAVVTGTDALRVLLADLADDGDDVARRTAISLLDRHRRRMAEIGVDVPD